MNCLSLWFTVSVVGELKLSPAVFVAKRNSNYTMALAVTVAVLTKSINVAVTPAITQ